MQYHHRGQTALCCLALLALCFSPSARAQQSTGWKTGPALREALAQHVGVTWSGQTQRKALENLAQAYAVAIVRDRRVDPDLRLDITATNRPLLDVLKQLAAQQECGVAVLDSVVYLGPTDSAASLTTLAAARKADVSKLSPDARGRLLTRATSSWDPLATPRELIAALIAQAGAKAEGLERVPHDLWAAADLPALTLVDRLTLLAVQYDLTFAIEADGATIRLVNVPEQPSLVRDYPLGGRSPEAIRKLAARVPGVEVRFSGERAYARGTLAALRSFEAVLAGRPAAANTAGGPSSTNPKPKGRSVYTLGVKDQPVGALVKTLAGKLGRTVRFEQPAIRQAGISLTQLVTFRVEEVSEEALLEACLKPAGLTHEIEGDVIVVRPAR